MIEDYSFFCRILFESSENYLLKEPQLSGPGVPAYKVGYYSRFFFLRTPFATSHLTLDLSFSLSSSYFFSFFKVSRVSFGTKQNYVDSKHKVYEPTRRVMLNNDK
jgi:hypothetical protein